MIKIQLVNININKHLTRGGFRFFSRGRGEGANFQKLFEIFSTFFCRSTKLNFRALPEQQIIPVLKFLSRRQNFEKSGQKGVFMQFLKKILPQNFGARSPPP